MNILLMAIDTLRADHLGCYGYARPTSPSIDRLASEGVRCTNFMAPGIPTHPSFTTLFSGQHPIRHGVVAHNGRNELDAKTPTLAQLFRERGFTTASFDNLPSHRSYFGRGFDIQSDASLQRGCGLLVSCEEINAGLIPFLRNSSQNDKPFFAFVHYWDPHTPYWAPPRYRSLFYSGDPCAPSKRSLDPLYAHPLGPRWRDTWFKKVLTDLGRPPGALLSDADFVAALYDQEIRHLDDGIGDVLEVLDETGLSENTLVVLLADHGECMTEHGIYFDHHGLYGENLRVPLIVRLPGSVPPGRAVTPLIQHLDILPTLCEFADLRLPECVDGVSAWGLISGQRNEDRLADFLVTEECSWQMKWALRNTKWNFILARQPDWYGTPHRELYDLVSDPHELYNLAEEKPEIARELEGELEGWIKNRLKDAGRTCDPLVEHGLSML